METPNCYDCKLIPWGHKCPHEYETLVRDSATVVVPHRNAGPDCPFVKLAKKDAELAKMKTKLEESTRVLADCEGNESNSYGMVTRQIIENRAALEGGE